MLWPITPGVWEVVLTMRISTFTCVVQVTRAAHDGGAQKSCTLLMSSAQLCPHVAMFCVHAGDHVGQRVDLEVKRMGFDTQNIWRVSDINSNYKYVSHARLSKAYWLLLLLLWCK